MLPAAVIGATTTTGTTNSTKKQPDTATTMVSQEKTMNTAVYRDHSHHTDDDKELNELLTKADAEGTKGTDQTFPVKLHQLLSGSDEDGFSHIVSWQPHGRSFIVKKHKEFVEKVLPCCFRQSKFPSFQRQLNLYGFRRITAGRDKGGYYHELFLRGRSLLALKMQRTKVKGTGARKPSQPDTEPDFYDMKFVLEKPSKKPAQLVTSPRAVTMPMSAVSPSSVSLQAPLHAVAYVSKYAPSPPLSSKPLVRGSYLGGMTTSVDLGMKSSLPSLLAPASMTNANRREIIDRMIANSTRMQNLAHSGNGGSSHLDFPAYNMRGCNTGNMPHDHPLGFGTSLLAGASAQRGPLHLNALNMPCMCAIPAF